MPGLALDARAPLDAAAERLASRLAERGAPSQRLAARRIEPFEGACALGAVDGGSAMVLEGDGLAVGAVRASALAWRAHAPWREEAAALEVRLLDEDLAAEVAEALPGLAPPEGPAALLERWRNARELAAALRLARTLGEGDVLALDGALARRDWPLSCTEELRAACGPRGVRLTGLCKSSGALLDGRPALLAATRAARGTPEPWLAPLPRDRDAVRHAVRFVRGARTFALETWPGEDAEDVAARLAPWTRDAGYAGYPYVLALAHNRCALDEGLVEDLGQALRGLAARRGVNHEAWEDAFGDFHDVLDRGR